MRPFGWDTYYAKLPETALDFLDGPVICCLEKSHYKFLERLKDKDVVIVIHDTVEQKKEAIPYLKNWKVIAIRPKIRDYLKSEHGIESTYTYHPFYPYPIPTEFIGRQKTKAVSISRVDWDKHTEIIIEANKTLLQHNKQIDIYGSINQIYNYHKLKGGLEPFYCGKVEKSFYQLSDILSKSKFVVDMSVISKDGGGTQYTFLEAIYNECALILHRKWLEGIEESDFKENYNCYAVSNEKELADLIIEDPDVSTVVKNAKKLLWRHTEVKWRYILAIQ